MSRHVELWRKIKQASMQATLGNDIKYALIKQWAQAFLEEVGDYGIAIFGKGVVRVSQLAESPEKYPEFVDHLFRIAGEGR